MYLANAFSLSMLERGDGYQQLHATPVSAAGAAEMARRAHQSGRLISCVGHADTARIFESILGVPVPVNRQSIVLASYWDAVLVGQYRGPRLPEGATSLPEGATIEWWHVQLVPPGFAE